MANPNASTRNGWIAGSEGLINVWRLTGSWSDQTWKEAGLIPDGDLVSQLGSMGSASFKMLRRARVEVDPADPKTIIQGSEFSFDVEAPLDSGDFICVTAGINSPDSMVDSDIVWIGMVVNVKRSEVLFDDAPGSVTAVELGACFDDKSPSGWAFIDRNATPTNVSIQETAATWNLPPLSYGTDLAQTKSQPNLILHPDQTTYPGLKIFFTDMLDLVADGTLLRGTKADLIRHAITIGRPASWPELELSLAPGTTAIIDSLDRNVEVVDPNGLKFRGLLDMAFPRAGGLAWYIGVSKPGILDPIKWKIVVVRTDAVETTLTANITQPVISLVNTDNTPSYDAVEVIGAPIVCCGTIPFRQPTPEYPYDFVIGTRGWTSAAETKYVKAELSILDGDLSSALHDEYLSTFRGQGNMARVYKAFRPNIFGGIYWAGDCSLIGTTGREGSRPENIENPDLRNPFFPTFHFVLGGDPTVWAAPSLIGKTSSVGFLDQDSYAFSPPPAVTLRALPWLPLRVGAVEDLTYQQVAAEQLLKPQLHFYDDYSAENMVLAPNNTGNTRPGIGLTPDTVTESVMLSVSPPDYFAFNRDGYRVSKEGEFREYLLSANITQPDAAYSWEDLLLTVAYPHQQRLRVLFYRDGRTDPAANTDDWIDYGWMPPALRAETERNLNVIRKLTVEEDRLQTWYVAPGTVLAVRYDKGEGLPLDIAPFITTPSNTHTFTRNDYDSAHAYAKRLARRYFREQSAYTIQTPRPDAKVSVGGEDVPLAPGQWINQLVLKDPDSATGRNKTINALVESVSRNFATGRMVVTTAAPTHPVFYNNGTISPSLGGPVSPSLGGTVAQAVGKLQSTVRDIQTAQASAAPVVPFTPTSGGGGGTGLVIVRVIGGNPISGTDHPFGRPFIRATPFWSADSELQELPTIPDWTTLDLPSTWEYGVTRIVGFPDGIGIGQLVRPYSLGTSSWDSGTAAPRYAAGAPVMNRAQLNAARTKIRLTGSSKTIVMTPATPAPPGPPVFTVTVDGTPATVSSYAAITAGAELTLSAAVEDTASAIVVTWGATSFTDPSGTPTTVPAGTLTATKLGDKYTTVFLLNNVGAQGFGDGDYVLVDTSAVSLADANGVSRTVYRIIGPASAAILHSHGTYGASGQGAAFLGFS